VHLLAPFDVFFVGLHCPVSELEKRELRRGDRPAGDARRDYDIVHAFCTYDIEMDSTQDPERNATVLVGAWRARKPPSAFASMLASELRTDDTAH
jgi:chloramphenicol 3-O phosphotransferase